MLQLRKTKKVFANFPRGFWRFPTKFQRLKKYCCPRAEDRAIFEDLRLRGQGQGLEASRPTPRTSKNVSSRTFSRPRTSSRTPHLIPTKSHRCKTSNLQFFIGVKFLSSLVEKFVKRYWLAHTTLGLYSILLCLREPSQFKSKSRNFHYSCFFYLAYNFA